MIKDKQKTQGMCLCLCIYSVGKQLSSSPEAFPQMPFLHMLHPGDFFLRGASVVLYVDDTLALVRQHAHFVITHTFKINMSKNSCIVSCPRISLNLIRVLNSVSTIYIFSKVDLNFKQFFDQFSFNLKFCFV